MPFKYMPFKYMPKRKVLFIHITEMTKACCVLHKLSSFECYMQLQGVKTFFLLHTYIVVLLLIYFAAVFKLANQCVFTYNRKVLGIHNLFTCMCISITVTSGATFLLTVNCQQRQKCHSLLQGNILVPLISIFKNLLAAKAFCLLPITGIIIKEF